MSRRKVLSGCSCAPMACRCPGAPWGRWHHASGIAGHESRRRHWPQCTPPQRGRCRGSLAAQTRPGGGTSGGTHSYSWATSHSCPHLLERGQQHHMKLCFTVVRGSTAGSMTVMLESSLNPSLNSYVTVLSKPVLHYFVASYQRHVAIIH